MAKRPMGLRRIYDVLRSNTNWRRRYLYEGGAYCNVGWFLNQNGVPAAALEHRQSTVGDDEDGEAVNRAATISGRSNGFWRDIMFINDESTSPRNNRRAIRAYLLQGATRYQAQQIARYGRFY